MPGDMNEDILIFLKISFILGDLDTNDELSIDEFCEIVESGGDFPKKDGPSPLELSDEV